MAYNNSLNFKINLLPQESGNGFLGNSDHHWDKIYTNNIYLCNSNENEMSYGDTLPTTNLAEGRLFFKQGLGNNSFKSINIYDDDNNNTFSVDKDGNMSLTKTAICYANSGLGFSHIHPETQTKATFGVGAGGNNFGITSSTFGGDWAIVWKSGKPTIYTLDNAGSKQVLLNTASGGGTSISLATSTWTTLDNFTLSPGKFLLMTTVGIASNSTGRRLLALMEDETTPSMSGGKYGICSDMRAAVPSSVTNLSLCTVIENSTTAKKTFYYRCWQNSGEALTTVLATHKIIRIA